MIYIACYHPLKAFNLGLKDNGKQRLKICSYEVHHLEQHSGQYAPMKCYWETISPDAQAVFSEYTEIPCGKCIGCMLDRSLDWTARLVLENMYHDESWFITLTYDPEHVKEVRSHDLDTGEYKILPTLVKRDLQLFLKRLRKYAEPKRIRFYASGEYGSKGRPHYHLIVFGLHLDPRKLNYLGNQNGNITYDSEEIKMLWPYGFNVCGTVTQASCGYVARYCNKKLYNHSDDYDQLGIEREFSTMSTHPALGSRYLEEHPDVVDLRSILYSTEDGGKELRLPHYFIRKLEETDPDKFAELKALRRERAEENKKSMLVNTDLSYTDYLEVQEENKKAQTKSLVRGVE